MMALLINITRLENVLRTNVRDVVTVLAISVIGSFRAYGI